VKLDWKSCIIGCISLFALYLAIYYWSSITSFVGIVASAASTLVLGAVIAYVVNILMSFYERRIAPNAKLAIWQNSRRTVCMVLAFLTVAGALILLLQLIVPQLTECFDKLVKAMPKAASSLYQWLNERFDLTGYLQNLDLSLPETTEEWRQQLEKYADVLLSGVGGVMNAAVSVTTSLAGMLITLFMSLIFACNILVGKEKLALQFSMLTERLLGTKLLKHVQHVVEVLDSCFHSYIVGQLIEALILGSLCALGMWILRLEYPLMIGALIGVMALIPIAGAYIGGALGAIMLFSVEPIQAIIFLVFLIILQQIEGNLIYPRTVGSTLHLPGIWVLAAVTIGGGVMGITGMLVFVPLTAALYRLLGEWVRHTDKPSLVESIASIDDAIPSVAVVARDPDSSSASEPAQQTAPANKPNMDIRNMSQRRRGKKK